MGARLRSFGLAVRRQPLLLAAVAAGILIGVLVMLPLGVTLPDPASNLVGACIGALAGVGGALAAVNASHGAEGTGIARYIERVASEPESRISLVIKLVHDKLPPKIESGPGKELDAAGWRWLAHGCEEAMEAIKRALRELVRVEPVVYKLSEMNLYALAEIETGLRDAEIAISKLYDSCKSHESIPIATPIENEELLEVLGALMALNMGASLLRHHLGKPSPEHLVI